MQDRPAAEVAEGPHAIAGIARAAAPDRRRRLRALAMCAAVALALHAMFLDGVGRFTPGVAETSMAAPLSVRTLPGDPGAEPAAEEAPVVAGPVAPAPVVVPARARPARRSREPAVAPELAQTATRDEASADIARAAPSAEAAASAPEVLPPSAVAGAEPPASSAVEAADVAVAPAASAAAGALPPLLAAGEQPPRLYRTQLPAPATLRYQVRRGFLRGTGEIRWQPVGDGYRLVLEARIAGLTLLVQTSEGAIDAHGLAPVRFLDQRARRSAQAANFRRDDGRVTFSGSGVEWPLLAGSQDRLSWMIQLAGIVAADPGLLVDGGRIEMVVVGARGDAAVWTLRYAGREDVETASGTVHAVKLVRDGRSAYDTSAEIWLDPARSYLPAHATLRNSSGASEYDLLLERVDLAP